MPNNSIREEIAVDESDMYVCVENRINEDPEDTRGGGGGEGWFR